MPRASQEDRILRLLESRAAEWVSAVELSNVSLQYASRVFALRKREIIENRVEIKNGVKSGFYRLAPPSTAPPAAITREQPTPQALPSAVSDSLFEGFGPAERCNYPD